MFSNVFSKSSVDAKNPPFKKIVIRNIKVDDAIKTDAELYVRDPDIDQRNTETVNTYGRMYNQFSAFFTVIESEYENIDAESNQWQDANVAVKELVEKNKNFAKYYVAEIDSSYGSDPNFIKAILDRSNSQVNLFEVALNKRFDILIDRVDDLDVNSKQDFIDEINTINNNIEHVDILVDDYYNAARAFNSLFLIMSSNFKINPWTEVMKGNPDLSGKFTDSEDKWNSRRNEITNDYIPELVKKINDTYINPNIRTVDRVQ